MKGELTKWVLFILCVCGLIFLVIRPATVYEYGVVSSITSTYSKYDYKVKIQVDGERIRLYT